MRTVPVAAERQRRNQLVLDGKPWRQHPTYAVDWCSECAGWYCVPNQEYPEHVHHPSPESYVAGCECIYCAVQTATRTRIDALVASATGEAPARPAAGRKEPWRPETRAEAEEALRRPLGPRERVRRIDGRILPPGSLTVTGRLLDLVERNARARGLTREEAIEDGLRWAEDQLVGTSRWDEEAATP